jgi:hypothetical protein
MVTLAMWRDSAIAEESIFDLGSSVRQQHLRRRCPPCLSY